MYELIFFGGLTRRYRRHYLTFSAAATAALNLLAKMDNRGAHPAIIYGPGCGKHGRTIA